MNQEELDFVEQPSEDFFCPVSAEFLLNPYQTICCGHHLSEKAVNRLERDGKPCPMCKEGKLITMPDKFFKRRTGAVLIRCPHKARGCEWVGEVDVSQQHIEACLKRAWKCQYCDFESTIEVEIQHEDECTKYPVPCPNKCEVRLVSQASPSSETQICMIPRCDVEKHRAECPLEVVACGFVDIGCKVKTTRQDLKRHMEESQQEHLLSATVLNLRLTKETVIDQLVEKDRLLVEKDRQLAEKDRQLAEKDRKLAEKNHQLAEKNCQLAEKKYLLAEKDKLAKQLTEKDHQVVEKDRQLANKDRQLEEKDKVIAMKDNQILEALVQLQHRVLDFTGGILGFTCHNFTLENFHECQKTGSHGDWHSEPFYYSFSEKYQIQLCVETRECGSHMFMRLKYDDQAVNGRTFVVALQLLNQQGNHDHFFRSFELLMRKSYLEFYSMSYDYIQFEKLYGRDSNIQYLKDDCLKFVLWIKEKNNY